MGPIQYFKQTILALGTPISLLFSLTTIPLILPITLPLIFLALIVLLILVLLELLLVLLVVLALLLRQLPFLLQSQSTPQSSTGTLRRGSETSTTRNEHVRNTSSSTQSIISKRKSNNDSRLQRVEGFRNRLGSCHESGTGTDMDSGIAHGYPTEYYPVSGFINANGQGTESTATFGIDSPRKKRFT